MNADPTDTRHSHLDLEDLVAGAAGQPVDDLAKAHLASCEQCQREATRWNLVADGVRGLTSATPEAAPPAQPRRSGRRGLPGPRRRAMLAIGSAAAALVLFVGVGTMTGYVHFSTSGSGTETTVTAVTGCSKLQLAAGTLEQVNGGSLVIKTASGRPVTVTTTAATPISMSGRLLGDITDGASVMVRGATSGGTIEAAIITVGQPFGVVHPARFIPVQGTVADAGTGGFTLVTSSGSRIPVSTSGDTLVIIPHASPGQLQAGATVFALGQAGPNGTLSAKAVASVSQLRSGHISVSTKVKDCSTRSIDEALAAITATPVSAG